MDDTYAMMQDYERWEMKQEAKAGGWLELTPRQREIIEHSLGNSTMYRNYFASEPEGDDFEALQQLVEMGLMIRGRDIPGGLIYFHVTDNGRRLAFT